LAAAARLNKVRSPFPEVLGPPDPATGERWSPGNELGHLDEALRFWTVQVRAVLAGATETGRGAAGYAERRQAIDAGRILPEQALRTQTAGAIQGLVGMLSTMKDSDLDREILHRGRAGDRRMELREFVEEFLVGHLEEHAQQLLALSSVD
jgi:hypothetical protein